jgi:hypothetical protein
MSTSHRLKTDPPRAPSIEGSVTRTQVCASLRGLPTQPDPASEQPTPHTAVQTTETNLEADPFAGDDAPWAPEDQPAPSPTDAQQIDPEAVDAALFYRGLALGLLASITAWITLGALGYALVLLLTE